MKKAFTLIELLFVIIIAAIFIGISIPNLKRNFNTFHLDNFSREVQSLMNYLNERSIIEREIISLIVDNNKRELRAKIKDVSIKAYQIPKGANIESEKERILFFPDGNIDKFEMKISGPGNQIIVLTTKGVFGGVKIQTQQ